MSPLTRAYLAFSRISGPLWRLALKRRAARGKEDPGRMPEKFGRYDVARPRGDVAWFHALSVGEALALLPLIERLVEERPGLNVVLTTSTASSAVALARAGLPEAIVHVLQPADTPAATRAFLDHWRPTLAVLAELDFWPRLMFETAGRGVPLVSVNVRVYDGSLRRRARAPGLTRDLLRLFDRILVQNEPSKDRLIALGAETARIVVAGPLKRAVRPLPCDERELARLQTAIADRPVWLAAATEASEHVAVLDAHRRVRERAPNALLIVAPRHVADGEDLARLAGGAPQRSRGDPPGDDAGLYIADTIGEMGLWYRLAPVSFIGHSLPGHGLTGKNPFEAAALGSALLSGSDTQDFSEIYDRLIAAGAVEIVHGPEDLAREILRLFDPAQRQPQLDAARSVIAEGDAILTRYLKPLKTYFNTG